MSEQASKRGKLIPSSLLGIHHIGMAVRNLSAAVDFYQTGASLENVSNTTFGGVPPETPEKIAVLKAPNGYIELMQFASANSAVASSVAVEGPGITHICYQSPATDELFKKFERLNATAVSRADPPIDLNGQGVRYAYSRDADNIMFEVEQLDVPQFEGPIWLAHIALVSHDIDRLVDFYTKLLGIEPYRRANKLGGPRWNEVTDLDNVHVRAAWFNTGNMVLELWQYVSPVTQASGAALSFDQIGYNKIAFEVGDLTKECERLAQTGTEILGAPVEQDGVSEVFARDPDGNLFSLLQTGPTAAAKVADLHQIDWLPSPSSPLAR